MKPKLDYTLYLVTDSVLMSTNTLAEAVTQAMAGGCTLVQLREKKASSLEFFRQAKELHEIIRSKDIGFIVNDRLDIALATEADGVHVGQSDLPARIARKLIGQDKILGVSVGNLQEALEAERDGADYLGVGAMFATDTKTDAGLTSIKELLRIRQAVSLPIVVIGGINQGTVPSFFGTGIDGIAVVSAIIAQKDIAQAAADMKQLFLSGMKGQRH